MGRIAQVLLIALLALAPTVAWADTDVTTSNSSDDTETQSGDASATNSSAAQVGHQGGGGSEVEADDVSNDNATNVQEGSNDASVTQRSEAVTGDGVAGQVLGGTATGTVDIVAANTSEDSEATSGESDEDSSSEIFSGLAATGVIEI